MAELITKIAGGARWLIYWLDALGFEFISESYNFMIQAMSGFNSEVVQKLASDLTKNAYIIVGIFALFKLAVSFINAIINPDKLTDKNEGVSNIAVHFVGAIILFVTVPIIFNFSREVQLMIVGGETDNSFFGGGHKSYTGNYIPQLLLGINLNNAGNAGEYMQYIATKSLITIDDRIGSKSGCGGDDECEAAIDAWNNGQLSTETVSNYISAYVKTSDGKYVFIYKYIPLLTLAIGLFMTYVLLSFTIDIALRSVELLVLEVLSPLFIITFVDPKMASSGPFNKWVKACTKSYLSLFIKIVIISLMLFLISNLDSLLKGMNAAGPLLKLLMIFAILIFAKKAPNWLGEMFGVSDGAGLGGLGIGKKLAGAALVGGAIGKGAEAGKNFAKQKAKNFAANRARNTSARIGAMKEQHAKNKQLKSLGGKKEMSMFSAGRSAAKNSRVDNWGKDSEGILKAAGTGYVAGRLGVNGDAKSLKERFKDNAEAKAKKYDNKIGNTPEAKAMRKKMAEDNAEAKKLYGNNLKMTKDGSGDREKVKLNGTGKEVYVNPQGAKEMNESFGRPTSEFSAYKAYGENLARSQGYAISGDNVVDSNGKVISSTAEYGMNNMEYSGKLAIKNLVASNVKADVDRYETSKVNMSTAASNYSSAVTEYNIAAKEFNNDANVQSAQSTIANHEQNVANLEKAKEKIKEMYGNADYKQLSESNYNDLTDSEKNRLMSYNVKIKSLESDYNSIISTVKSSEKDYEEAKNICKAAEDSYGLSTLKTNLIESKKTVDAWTNEVSIIEKKIKETESLVYDDNGNLKKDSNGNVVMSNPYDVLVDGEKLNPVDNFTRINEIKNMHAINVSKSEKKYKESLKDSSDDKK